MDPLPRVSMVNVDPARMPVSAQLLQGIRRVVLEQADKMRDTDAILAEVATAVMELETYVGELRADLQALTGAVCRLVDTVGASNDTVGNVNDALGNLAKVVRKVVDRIEPPQ